jgi:hypothetical protein
MRSLLLVLACGLAVAQSVAAPAEDFRTFLTRFVLDEGFRLSRITFPLRAVLGEPTDPRIREQWSEQEVHEKFTVPVLNERSESWVRSGITYPSTVDAQLRQLQFDSDVYVLIYRFTLKRGQWFLAEFEMQSWRHTAQLRLAADGGRVRAGAN